MEQRYEYDVVELKESFGFGTKGTAPSAKLKKMLNQRAAEGWQLKHLVSSEVASALGGRSGWMVIFERAATGDATALEGWHPDPHGGPGHRWWDGTAWTDRTR